MKFLILTAPLLFCAALGCRERISVTSVASTPAVTAVSYYEKASELPDLKCDTGEEIHPFALGASSPVPSSQDLGFATPVTVTSPDSPFDRYLLQLYVCDTGIGNPRLFGIKMLRQYFGMGMYYLIIPGLDAQINGLSEMVFGGDMEAFEVLAPFNEQVLQIKGKQVGGRGLSYVGLGQRAEGGIDLGGWITVGAWGLKDIFGKEQTCAPGSLEKTKEFDFSSHRFAMTVSYCETPALRSHAVEVKTVVITDLKLGSEEVTLKSTDGGFAEKVKYTITQHNWSDTFTISLQDVRYEFAGSELSAVYPDGSRWSENVGCPGGLVACPL
ncbi:MAG: hypothetical protein AB7T49_17990 [Oligoflexales bacterium]